MLTPPALERDEKGSKVFCDLVGTGAFVEETGAVEGGRGDDDVEREEIVIGDEGGIDE